MSKDKGQPKEPIWTLLDKLTDRRQRVEEEEARRGPELSDADYEA